MKLKNRTISLVTTQCIRMGVSLVKWLPGTDFLPENPRRQLF